MPRSSNKETVFSDPFTDQGLKMSTLKLLDEELSSMEVEDVGVNKRKRSAHDVLNDVEIDKKRLKSYKSSLENVSKKIVTVEVRKQDLEHHNNESSTTFAPKKRISHIP